MLVRLVRQALARSRRRPALDPVAGYDRWSKSYDDEPKNLVVKVDESVFAELVARVSLKGCIVVDVGCGTGRHWRTILDGNPASLVGYDASSGMLARLSAKHPGATVHRANADHLRQTPNATCDVVVSTLTLCHVPEMSAALEEFARVLKPGGHILLTDFHPAAAADGVCSFRDDGGPASIRLHPYTVRELEAAAASERLSIEHRAERVVDESMRASYVAHGMRDVFERAKGAPLVYGMHLRKGAGPAA